MPLLPSAWRSDKQLHDIQPQVVLFNDVKTCPLQVYPGLSVDVCANDAPDKWVSGTHCLAKNGLAAEDVFEHDELT